MTARRALVRRILLGALAALAVAQAVALPADAAAQGAARRAAESRRVPRRLLYSALGVLASGIAVSAYALADEDGNGRGACSSKACVVPVTVLGGSLVGFMIGKEHDELHALRYRRGAPLAIASVTVPVEQSALLVAVRDSLVAVSGATGVQLYASTPRGLRALGRRAGGVRGITALDLAPGAGALVVASSAGSYVFPPVEGPGTLVREGATTALAAGGDRIWFAVGTRVESAPVGADTSRTWPGVDVGQAVRTLHHDTAHGIVWAGGDSALVALRPAGDSLVEVGRAPVDGAVLALHAGAAGRLVASLGEGGLRLFDISDAAAPVERGRWTGTRFVYDAAVVSPTLVIVAAGPEGLFVLDVSGPEPRVAGLARELGFVTAIVLRGGHAFLLDRQGDLLRRIDPSLL